ncbi:D-alanyl-D-alanine carboxypeptidase family protein [Streptomyces sp. NPDC059788]|uniref:D-alanyl-D-alanine carboxypeptidase family protein n=1 Tax=Streptomyces sp. NPDC059788 TaxID=3346948 RepID=UPI00365D11CA
MAARTAVRRAPFAAGGALGGFGRGTGGLSFSSRSSDNWIYAEETSVAGATPDTSKKQEEGAGAKSPGERDPRVVIAGPSRLAVEGTSAEATAESSAESSADATAEGSEGSGRAVGAEAGAETEESEKGTESKGKGKESKSEEGEEGKAGASKAEAGASRDAEGKTGVGKAAGADGADVKAGAGTDVVVPVAKTTVVKATSVKAIGPGAPATEAPAPKAPAPKVPTPKVPAPKAPVPKASVPEVTAATATATAKSDTAEPAAAGSAVAKPAAAEPTVAEPPAAKPAAAKPTPTPTTPLPHSERTKQQPLPPVPAMDLLAQLTNSPPPPETPLRTVVRRVKIWVPLVVLLVIVLGVVQQVRPLPDPVLVLGERSSYTFAGEKFRMPWPDEGQAAARVVGAGDVGVYGQQKPVPTASVAKVMTAYLILKEHPLKAGEQGPKITVDAQAAKEAGAENESRVDVQKGQSFSEFQMLQMVLIPSGNNIARLLARWDAETEEAFIGKMNAEAKALGMTDTTYTDPSGFKDSTRSTAVDQLKLAEAVMGNGVVRKIVAMPNATVPGLRERLENNNSPLLIKGAGVLGVKTGSSSPAGGALMWAARRTVDGTPRTIVGVTLDQHFKGADPNAENSLKLVLDRSYTMIRAVQDALTSAVVVKKGDVVGYVDDGLGGRTPVVATGSLRAVGWPGMRAEFSIGGGEAGRSGDRTSVPGEAKAGTVVGRLTIGSGAGRATVPIALQKDMAEPSFGARLTRIS